MYTGREITELLKENLLKLHGCKELLTSQLIRFRTSCPEMFCKKGVLKNFTKFTGKHLCQSLFFNIVADLSPAPLLKRDSGTGASCEFCEVSKNTLFYRTPLLAAFKVYGSSSRLVVMC